MTTTTQARTPVFAMVRITTDEAKIRSCPDLQEEQTIRNWRPFAGTYIKVHLPAKKKEDVPNFPGKCDGWLWKVSREDHERIRPNDACEGRWACEHNLDID